MCELKKDGDDIRDIQDWMRSLYQVDQYTDDFVAQMNEQFSYKGFNRHDVLKQLKERIQDNSLVAQIIVATALRGPQVASGIKLLNGRTPASMGIPASNQKGSRNLSLNKVLAATADIAAYFLKKMKVPKRINMDLDAHLQFPSAGSIKMSDELRVKHKEFCVKFSKLIGGEFNEQIYDQMVINSYYDENLKIF